MVMKVNPNKWLDQTKEEIIEPEIAICDPHHHFWDQRVERGYPRYQLDELLADITSGHNVDPQFSLKHGRCIALVCQLNNGR